jgi:hypothetical protein
MRAELDHLKALGNMALQEHPLSLQSISLPYWDNRKGFTVVVLCVQQFSNPSFCFLKKPY